MGVNSAVTSSSQLIYIVILEQSLTLTAEQESAVTSAAQLEGVLNQHGVDTR